MIPFKDILVRRAFESYPAGIRAKLLALREVIFRTASEIEGVGELDETLKWGEPAYLTSQSKSGSTIRLGAPKAKPDHYALYFNCQTSLVETYRTLFPSELKFEGNRAIFFHESDVVSPDIITFCIATALTYHRKTPPLPASH